MDKLSPERRSENMRRIRSSNTKPELAVRRLVHRMGFRFRLHSKLPGRPDLVFPSKKRVVFINGCFWHQHCEKRCQDARVPKSNLSFWIPKLQRNKARDIVNRRKLSRLGWKTLVVWDCQLRNEEKLANRLVKFLSA